MWQFSPQVPEDQPLGIHIDALWQAIRGKRDFLLELKQTASVDVFLGYRSNCDHAGLEIPYQQLELFTELQIPLGVSVIIC